MLQHWKAQLTSEDGAVTVDWVVLSAAVIGLGMIALLPIAYSTENATRNVADYIKDVPVGNGSN